MIDRASKFLLTAIALLLLALLVRPMLVSTPVQAQAAIVPVQAPVQMVVDNNAIYLLQNGKLSVYFVETPTSKKMLNQLGLGANDPVTLRRVVTVDVNKP